MATSYDESFRTIVRKLGKVAPKYLPEAMRASERRRAAGEDVTIATLLVQAGLIDAAVVRAV